MPDEDKGDNVGAGLSAELLSSITGQLTGAGAKGTAQEQAAVFLALTKEEQAARRPGNGTASVADAFAKYVAIVQAEAELALAPAGTSGQATAAINKLVPAIQGLGKLWTDFGPVPGGFSDAVKNKP